MRLQKLPLSEDLAIIWDPFGDPSFDGDHPGLGIPMLTGTSLGLYRPYFYQAAVVYKEEEILC